MIVKVGETNLKLIIETNVFSGHSIQSSKFAGLEMEIRKINVQQWGEPLLLRF